MNSRPRLHVTFRRSTVIGIAIAAIVAAVVTGNVLAASGPSKQDFLNKVATAEATAATGPRAAKPPSAGHGVPPSASCTNTVHTGIFPAGELPFHADGTFTTETEVVSGAGDPYFIYAGALQSDSQQGVLLVMREDKDPCAVAAGQVPSHAYMRSYPSPFRRGALTLTQIVGDAVDFSVADGSRGSFNYVLEQYLSS